MTHHTAIPHLAAVDARHVQIVPALAESARAPGCFLSDVMKRNAARLNFRVFGPPSRGVHTGRSPRRLGGLLRSSRQLGAA